MKEEGHSYHNIDYSSKFNEFSKFNSRFRQVQDKRVYVLRCPRCGNIMKYSPRQSRKNNSGLENKKKRCVYCGKSFKVKDHIIKIEYC